MTPDVLDRRVAALRQARPDLQAAIDVQEKLLRASIEVPRPPHTEPFPMPRERVEAKVRDGQPLLHGEPVSIDVHYAADLFGRMVNLLGPTSGEQLEPIVAAATSGELDPERLFTEAFVQHHEHLAELAMEIGLDADVLDMLASRCVAPLLRAYAAHLLPLLETELWTRGYCPICGGWPAVGELRGVELAQYLRCVACGSGWRARRLGCPYCGNDDFRTLGSLRIEGEQRFRINVCDACKGYLKVGNAFDPPPAELVPLDDVASLHLDVAAIERGYHRPTGTGFSIELAVPDAEWTDEL